MPDVGYPYTQFWMGPSATSAPASPLSIPTSSAAPSGASDLKSSVKSFSIEMTSDEIDQTSIGDTVKRIVRGRTDMSMTLTLYVDDVSAKLVGAADDAGSQYYPLYLERGATGGGSARKFYASTQISGITERVGDDGSTEYELTLKNAGPAPVRG